MAILPHLENQSDGRNPWIVLVFPFWHIPVSIADSNTIVTATSILGVQQLNGTIVHYIRHKGVQKFKMAARKPEVLLSQLVDEIKTQLFLHNSKVSYICNTVIAKHYFQTLHHVLHVRYI